MKTVSVKVQRDHLEALTRVRKPAFAIAELIWNGLDADATEIRVQFELNKMNGLETVRVIDNGVGLASEDAVAAFENLGGSWKPRATKSKKRRRILHGRQGRGRFRAFALGDHVEWRVRFSRDGSLLQYVITGDRSRLGTFEIGDERASEAAKSGTQVEITNIAKNFPSLQTDQAAQDLTEHFALYMRQYPDVSIVYDGAVLNPSAMEKSVAEYSLDPIELEDRRLVKVDLTIIEWNVTTAQRSLVLCDANGFALAEIPPKIQAPGFTFTGYLKSDYLRDLDSQGALVFEELLPDLKKVLDTGKTKMREHFRRLASQAATSVVEQWKKDRLYPYEGEPSDILEQTERQVFDVFALNVNAYLPDFETADPKSKKFALRLLKHALESSPSAVRLILQEVLDLPEEKQEELVELLKKTSLAALITASKVVSDRLNFITGLELLLFDPRSREAILERKELHRILAQETWIFGEEFNLTVDDQSLTEVLNKHLELLGRKAGGDGAVDPVVREDGTEGIVDLMLSRALILRPDEREHLVVELKRPSVKIDDKVAAQVKSYARVVASDERFNNTKTKWAFWAVSNEISDGVQTDASQRNRPEGLLVEDRDGVYTVWVKTWGQIIQSCKARLHFFQERLQYSADHDSAIAYLRERHERYLPQVLREAVSGS